MKNNTSSPGLPQPLRVYIALVGIVGMAWLTYLTQRVEWGLSTLGEMSLFILLIVVAGSFLLRVGPRVKSDVSTCALFGAAILLEPGVAALAGVIGVVTYTLLLRFWGEKLHLPWYKYPFNAGATAIGMGLTSVIFHDLAAGDGLLTPALMLAAASCYVINTSLVSCAASLQLGINPLRFWWMGTKENGLVELSLFAFASLGAIAYQQSPWTIVILFIPVAIIYVAFSRLAQHIREREQAEEALKKAKEELEIRVELRTAELSGANEELGLSRRRIVHAQEQLRKAVAQQLHGPVQNRLLVATHWLHEAQGNMGADLDKCAEHLAKAANLIDEINQGDLRSAMSRLHPSLIRISLHASLRSLADQFHSSFEVELHADEDEPATEELWRVGLPEELRLAIYRVVEEALSNVLKHTMATRVELRLDHPSEDRVTVTIRDNGSGFDVNTTTPGFGILSIQDYCGAVGGVLQIKSDVGEGTTISSSFPISTNNATATSPSFVTGLPNGVACASSSEGNDVGSVYLEQVMHQKAEAATTLLVVDDQPDYCGLVKELLKPYEEFQVVGEGHDGPRRPQISRGVASRGRTVGH